LPQGGLVSFRRAYAAEKHLSVVWFLPKEVEILGGLRLASRIKPCLCGVLLEHVRCMC